MSDDPFRPLGRRLANSDGGPPKADPPAWLPILPVPADAATPPAAHYKLGKASATWTYRDGDGRVLGYVLRFDTADGKETRPLTFCERAKGDGAPEWRWQGFGVPRPLYGLDRLAAAPADAPVVVCEGEKAADAAAELLPDWVAVTSPNGSKSAGKADWRPLAGRRVTVWGDADDAGRAYAAAVAAALAPIAAAVAITEPPEGVAEGWDAADAKAEGWNNEQAAALLSVAVPVDRTEAAPTGAEGESKGGGSGRKAARVRGLVELADGPGVELWHSPDGECWATVPLGDRLENCRIGEREFRRWLVARAYDEQGEPPGAQVLQSVLDTIEIRALRGRCHQVFVRIGEAAGRVYLDLCDERRRVVEVSASGWAVLDRAPPVKFYRAATSRPLPVPEAGGSVNLLRGLVNIGTEGDFRLMLGWLVGAFRPAGPYAILTVGGEQGSGKTGLCEVLARFIDPRKAGLAQLPRDERDLAIAAEGSWLVAFDNCSGIAPWLSDALCRVATGTGFRTRRLHSDRDEVTIEACRPMLFNGISSDLSSRPDFADRAIVLDLPRIEDGDYEPPEAIASRIEAVAPEVLGALLDGVASALRNYDDVELGQPSRMVGLTRWAEAATEGLGFAPGDFANAYAVNRQEAAERLFADDPVVQAVTAAVDDLGGTFDGSARELLALLDERVGERARNARTWPKSAQRLGSELKRLAPLIRRAGFDMAHRHSNGKVWRIVRRSKT